MDWSEGGKSKLVVSLARSAEMESFLSLFLPSELETGKLNSSPRRRGPRGVGSFF